MAEEGQTETEPKKKSNKSKDKIIEALTESNESYKKQIELLEKRYKELENKVMAPIRNDEAFLLRLYTEHKNKKHFEMEQSPIEWDNEIFENAIKYGEYLGIYINLDYMIYTSNKAVIPIHKSFFTPGCDVNNYIKCLLIPPIPIDSKKYIGQIIIKHRTHCKFNALISCPIKPNRVMLNVGINTNKELKLWIEIYIKMDTKEQIVYIIELDDLTDKVAIENLYKKENLLE